MARNREYAAAKNPAMTPCYLVVTMRLPERPGAARIAIAGLDISQPPLDLGGRVGHPVRARTSHLAPGQRLRNAVRAAGILGVVPPAAFPRVDVVQAAEIRARAPAERREHVVRDALGRAGVRRRRSRHGGRRAARGTP